MDFAGTRVGTNPYYRKGSGTETGRSDLRRLPVGTMKRCPVEVSETPRDLSLMLRLVLVVLQADFELANCFVDRLDGLHAVAPEVMRGVLEMFLGIAQ